jgi:hypothetical protein
MKKKIKLKIKFKKVWKKISGGKYE